MGSLAVSKDQSRLPWRGTAGEIRRGERRASDRTKEREYADLGLDLVEREEQVTWHALALALTMTDKACRKQSCKLDDLHAFYARQQKPYVFR